ncbi:MAG: NUMOD4 domain-containing protein [Dehalococcoidia bacterium]
MADYQYNPDVEQWKDIPDFPGYQVSNHGRVRSYKNKNGRRLESTPQTILKPVIIKGYANVSLSIDGIQILKKIHRLVLETFIGPCPDGHEGCHNDGIPTHNCLFNLRWGTKSDNYQDRHAHGTHNMGTKNGRAKLSDGQVREIRKLYCEGYSQSQIGRLFSLTQASISSIVLRKQWAHVI